MSNIPAVDEAPSDFTVPYSFTLPCRGEEKEVADERQRQVDAIARLRQRLKEERENCSGEPDTADDDDGYLRAIFPSPTTSEKRNPSSDDNSNSQTRRHFDGEDEDKRSGKKVGAPVIGRTRNVRAPPDLNNFLANGISAVKVRVLSQLPSTSRFSPNLLITCYLQHGRSGNPKNRQIMYDSISKELKWKSHLELSGSIIDRMFKSTALVSAQEMAAGIKLSDITSVVRGINTDVLLKASLVDPRSSLSIISVSRTLDLTLVSHNERDTFFKTLRDLMNSECPNHSVSFS